MPDNSFHLDFSGRLTFEMFNVPADSYRPACNDLVAAMHLVPMGNLVTDFLSIVFQGYQCGSQRVGLEWDNWSGFIVVAKTSESEPLVQAIAEWLLSSKWATIPSDAERGADGGGRRYSGYGFCDRHGGLGRSLYEVTMAVDVTLIVKKLLAANRGPDPTAPGLRQPPDYGVVASLEGNVLDVVLTFKKERAYCCSEWGCHMALYNGRRWERLREALAESGVVASPSLRLQLCCKIEEGAVFFDFSKPDRNRRGWYGFKPVTAHDYKVVSVEADIE